MIYPLLNILAIPELASQCSEPFTPADPENAIAAKEAGLELITWTLEGSGPLANGGGWYYQTIGDITNNDGEKMVLLDVLAREVGVKGIFTDWPGTVRYYASYTGIAPAL